MDMKSSGVDSRDPRGTAQPTYWRDKDNLGTQERTLSAWRRRKTSLEGDILGGTGRKDFVARRSMEEQHSRQREQHGQRLGGMKEGGLLGERCPQGS